MRKLKLDLTKLEVTSFETPAETGARGTVAGNLHDQPASNADTCDGSYTCYASCANTCQGTCCGGVCGSWPMTHCPQCYFD
jgi:hypothetical protein